MMDELVPLIESSPQRNCRESRPHYLVYQWGSTKQLLSNLLRFFFWSSGYNKRLTSLSQLYSFYLFIVCWYQVCYEIARIAGCPEFKCKSNNVTVHSTKQLEYASFLSASIGSACSYTFMLLCLNMIYKPRGNGISPYFGLKDMANSKAKIILITMLISGGIFIGYIALFVYIYYTEGHKPRRAVYLISLSCEFIAEWVAIVSLYAFSCSSFAVGAFAADTLRRIKTLTGETIDDVIKIHKELRLIVKETTDAYSTWFLLHWLIFGITVIIGFVVVALHKFGHDEVIKKTYFGTYFALHVFLFIYPCACAAYITSTCASISAKINNTTSEDWKEGHIFKDRRQLQMFVSYCSASPVCFKIGRITFTSTLAWFSFFFGGTGLLFHFF